MQDTVQYNNSVVGFQTALARQEGLCSRLPILTFQCQKICVCFWCGAAKRRHFFAVITVSEPVHEAVRKILPLVGKRIRTEQGCCGSGLLLIKAFRLRREAHQLIEKVTKLVDGDPRRGYSDLAASVIGCPDTAHIPLFTQPCEVRIVNGVLPTSFRKCLPDRLRDLLKFQQIAVQMDALFIVQRDRLQNGQRRNGKFPGQKSIEKIRSLAPCDDVRPCTGVFA